MTPRPSQVAAVAMAFIGQSAPDIRKKLQGIEGLQDYTLQDLVKEAEKVYHKRDSRRPVRPAGFSEKEGWLVFQL